ncbi:MAG TPA: dihydrolipoamide acetyltransferase family protein [Sporolactobacillaceae bacterium]|nr:dihydrolipoamide acetyltransferase family protein [Sporolactobacillaceae bacterium]
MVEIKLHDIGEGMTEGEVLQLFVKEGDQVRNDQALVEIQTDKITAELPSPVSGMIKKILIREGDLVQVGETLLIVDGEMTESPVHPSADYRHEEKIDDHRETGVSLPQGPKRILAAPHTRRLARRHGVNLESLEGTGRLGRITTEDVERAIQDAVGDVKPVRPETTPVPVSKDPSHSESCELKYAYKEIPFKGRRKVIAERMTHSLFTIPHVTHFDEADVTSLLKIKERLKVYDPDGSKGYNVSLVAFFIKAIAVALKAFPIFNAQLDDERHVIRMVNTVNMGLATDTEEGLIVPVLKAVEKKSISDIHAEMKQLIKKAKQGELKREELVGGTFTISNVGPLGSTGATPIINYPEVGLIAFHKTKKRPVVDEQDAIVIRSMMNLSMSFDHRVADGAQAVAFTNKVIELIEHPELLLLT